MADDFFSNPHVSQTAPRSTTADEQGLDPFQAAIGRRFQNENPSVLLTSHPLPLATPGPIPSAHNVDHQKRPFDTAPAFTLRAPPRRGVMTSNVSTTQTAVSPTLPTTSPSFASTSTSTPTTNHISFIQTPSGSISQLSIPNVRTRLPSSSSSSRSTSVAPSSPTNTPRHPQTSNAHPFISHPYQDLVHLIQRAAPSDSSSPSSPVPLNTPRTLIVDLRNHTQYVTSRVRHSINLSVPSTLLKRPAYSLVRLADMISLPSDRARFKAWSTASHIIVLDADTAVLSPGNNILGILNKFQAEGFTGKLGYLEGGFNRLVKTAEGRACVETRPLTPPLANGEDQGMGLLQSRQLPPSAFQQSSTVQAGMSRPSHSGGGMSALNASTLPKPPTRLAVANPFYDNIRQNLELSSGINERIPLAISPLILSRANELPFAWLRDIVRKASARSEDGIVGGEALEDLAMQFYRIELGEQRRLNGVMEHHSNESGMVVSGSNMGAARARGGASQRARKNSGGAESRSTAASDDSPAKREASVDSSEEVDKEKVSEKEPSFPYSITAGVEKGTKNRYRNIWPFEHARVRLQRPFDRDRSGYINASYVQPRCTTLQYIATQGPLHETFADFWTLVWEQGVHVIVMLTRQIEDGQVKCHPYWKGEQHGKLRISLESVDGDEEGEGEGGVGADLLRPGGSGVLGFNFGTNEAETKNTSSAAIIRRTFLLSHVDYPKEPPRKVVQLQFLGWPDLNVPSDSRQLLELIRQLDELRKEFRSSGSGLGKYDNLVDEDEDEGDKHDGADNRTREESSIGSAADDSRLLTSESGSSRKVGSLSRLSSRSSSNPSSSRSHPSSSRSSDPMSTNVTSMSSKESLETAATSLAAEPEYEGEVEDVMDHDKGKGKATADSVFADAEDGDADLEEEEEEDTSERPSISPLKKPLKKKKKHQEPKLKREPSPGPVLVHCSAGVGRTGSFVIVDAVLDAVRREAKAKRRLESDPTPPLEVAAQAAAAFGASQAATGVRATINKAVGSVDDASALLAASYPTSALMDEDEPSFPAPALAPSIFTSAPTPVTPPAVAVRLDSRGNQVISPEQKSVKKRRSSNGAGVGALGRSSTVGTPAVPHTSASLSTTSLGLETASGAGSSVTDLNAVAESALEDPSSSPTPAPAIPVFQLDPSKLRARQRPSSLGLPTSIEERRSAPGDLRPGAFYSAAATAATSTTALSVLSVDGASSVTTDHGRFQGSTSSSSGTLAGSSSTAPTSLLSSEWKSPDSADSSARVLLSSPLNPLRAPHVRRAGTGLRLDSMDMDTDEDGDAEGNNGGVTVDADTDEEMGVGASSRMNFPLQLPSGFVTAPIRSMNNSSSTAFFSSHGTPAGDAFGASTNSLLHILRPSQVSGTTPFTLKLPGFKDVPGSTMTLNLENLTASSKRQGNLDVMHSQNISSHRELPSGVDPNVAPPSPGASGATVNQSNARFASAAPSELVPRIPKKGSGHHSRTKRGDPQAPSYEYALPRRIRLSHDVKVNLRAVDKKNAAEDRVLAARAAALVSGAPLPGLRTSALSTRLSHARLASLPKVEEDASRDSTGNSPAMNPNVNPGGENSGSGSGITSQINSSPEERTSSSDEMPPSPPDPLEEIEEPIREVLEDMREQRMSLCQTLRQYVFVHLAILEGSLAIVDELNAEEGGPKHPRLSPRMRKAHLTPQTVVPALDYITSKRPSMKRKKQSVESQSPRDERMLID